MEARFRIKKKQKAVNLERSVSDLTGRAEELEREASDLRRENGWLKEIVMLKGTRYAAANLSHRMALNQAAALAIGNTQGGSGGSGASKSAQSSSTYEAKPGSSNEEEEDEEEEEEEEYIAPRAKQTDSSGKRK